MSEARSEAILDLDATALQQLGQRLRELRLAAKLSADAAAAQALGYAHGHSTVLRIERGASPRVKTDTVERLAAVYGTTLDAVLAGAPTAGNGVNGRASNSTQAEPVPEHVSTEGEDMRHDPLGWTSTRARAARYVGR